MKRIFMFVGLLMLVISAFAEPTHQLDLICCSYHFDRSKDRNETNLGLEYRYIFDTEIDTSFNIGVYKNSEYTTSVYAGVGRAFPITKKIDFTIEVGAVTGYERMPVFPVIVPGLSFYDTVHLRLTPEVVGASVTLFRW